MFNRPGFAELLVILGVALLFFGAKKLPEIGSGLGRAIRNFKRASTELDEVDITATKKDTTTSSHDKDERI